MKKIRKLNYLETNELIEKWDQFYAMLREDTRGVLKLEADSEPFNFDRVAVSVGSIAFCDKHEGATLIIDSTKIDDVDISGDTIHVITEAPSESFTIRVK